MVKRFLTRVAPVGLVCSLAMNIAANGGCVDNQTAELSTEGATCDGPSKQWLIYEPPQAKNGLLEALPSGDFTVAETGNYTVDFKDSIEDQYDLQEKDRLVLATVFTRVCQKNTHCVSEILSGAYTVLTGDQGEFYEFVKSEVPGSYVRKSSHESSSHQYGVRLGNSLKTILTGTNSSSDSWFQFEGSPWDPFQDPIGSMKHCMDYVTYRITGKNVGPMGLSSFKESNPLKLQLSPN